MPVTEQQTILPDNYSFLQRHVYAQSGIVVDENKHYLFESRLAPVVTRLGIGSINRLCDLLRSNEKQQLSREVVEAMTTNETYFFRDPAQYDAIRTQLLPGLRKAQASGRRLRFWSAASSTGQEAYSLAMLLLEEGFANTGVEILGTDFASRAVDRARAGRYQQIEVNRGVPAKMLVKYFTRTGVDWQLKDEPRRMARFEQIDLRKPLGSLGTFDLVFCRNVMIYFDTQTKAGLLEQLRGCLLKGGWLLLGAAEVGKDLDRWFERQSHSGATVYIAK